MYKPAVVLWDESSGGGEKRAIFECVQQGALLSMSWHTWDERGFRGSCSRHPDHPKQCNYSSTTTFEMPRCPSPVRKVHVFQLVSFAACGIYLAFSESIDWIYCWVNHNINICSWGAWLEKYLLCWAEQRLLPELLCTALGEAGFQTDVTDTAGKTDRLLGTTLIWRSAFVLFWFLGFLDVLGVLAFEFTELRTSWTSLFRGSLTHFDKPIDFAFQSLLLVLLLWK